jgi:uncharacterized protein (DUF427 family)
MTDLSPEDVQSYPRPPRLEPVPQRIRILLHGTLVVDTTRALRVLETHHPPTYYLPAQDFTATLRPARGSSLCEWKGRARYFDILAGGSIAPSAAWSYDHPTPAFAALAGHVAVYAAAMTECRVGDVLALPQPGGFYGGWVTPNQTGHIKGAPGTEHW